jgi:hypothetical protein
MLSENRNIRSANVIVMIARKSQRAIGAGGCQHENRGKWNCRNV